MTQRALIKEIEDNSLRLYIIPMDKTVRGLCIGKSIVLNRDIDSVGEFNCVLAEEIGHYKTTVGDITTPCTDSARQERRARIYAYNRLIGLKGLVDAWEAGCRTAGEAAEYLCITEEFFLEGIEYYRSRYGVGVDYEGRFIRLMPTLEIQEKQAGTI